MSEHKKEDAAVLSLLILYLLVFLPSHFVFAQNPLVPCGITFQCQLCDLVVLVQNVINFIILYLAAPVATLLIAWAGIKLIVNAENEGERTKAKQLLKDILVGFLWVLCAWFVVILIVGTLVKDAGVASKDSPWFKIECNRPAYGPLDTKLDQAQPGLIVFTPSGAVGAYSQIQAQEKFSSAGNISVFSTGNCNDQNNPSCTSLQGIQPKTVDGVINLRQACGSSCSIVISGGTEVGHSEGGASHSAGDKVDISIKGSSSSFNTFITKTLKAQNNNMMPANTTLQMQVSGKKYEVRYEIDHYDIRVI
ncbi:MAG: pilin [bacterium]|nr:pilin [bacterium]